MESPEIKKPEEIIEELEIFGTNGLHWTEMLQASLIYRNNYDDNPELREAILEKFNIEKGDENTIYLVLKEKSSDDIKGFFRLDMLEEGKYKFSAFNIHPSLKSLGLGKRLFSFLNNFSKYNILYGEADMSKDILCFYLENGFCAVETVNKLGINVVSIVKNETLETSLIESQSFSKDFILNKVKESSLVEENNFLFIKISSESFRSGEYKSFIGPVDGLNYRILTRAILDSADYVLVFEILNNESFDRIKNSNEHIESEEVVKID